MQRQLLHLVLALVVALGASSGVVQAAASLSFGQMYAGSTVRGLVLSDYLQSLAGQEVEMTGFMAPPLTPTITFFVLTEVPFCSTDADWPNNIVVVKLQEPVVALPFDAPITVRGSLELGSAVDAETGFVSLVRINAYSVNAQ